MVLSDQEIETELRTGKLIISPEIGETQIGPSSIDLRLSDTFTVFKKDPNLVGLETVINLANVANVEAIINAMGEEPDLEQDGSCVINPGDFLLAYTREHIQLPNYLAARVEGRSSLARFGLSIHQTAPTVHATFKGQLRLEIMHNGPVPCKLSPGMAICQLILERLGSPAVRTISSNFQNQSQSSL